MPGKRGRRGRSGRGGSSIGYANNIAAVPVSVVVSTIAHRFEQSAVQIFKPNVAGVDSAVRPTSINLMASAQAACFIEIEAMVGASSATANTVVRTRPCLLGPDPVTIRLKSSRSVDPSNFACWRVRVGGPCYIAGTCTFSVRDAISSNKEAFLVVE